MLIRRILLVIIISSSILRYGFSQENETIRDLHFSGIVMDGKTSVPVAGVQVKINNLFSASSGEDGTFGIIVGENDTVTFTHLGYKPTIWHVAADTLRGKDFVAGIYLNADTISIGEVIIMPRFINLKSLILNSPSKVPSTMENARYNVAISAYQGKTTTGKLGDPESNYNLMHQRQSVAAYEKGQIPSSAIAGISPLLLLPAAYLLIHGLPEKPDSFENKPTQKEIEKIKEEYFRHLSITVGLKTDGN